MTVFAINLSKVPDKGTRDAFMAVLRLMEELRDTPPGTPGFVFVDVETPSGTIDGANAAFTVTYSPNPTTSLMLFKNGVFQTPGGVDYTLSGNTITYVAGAIPVTGDAHVATYRH